ncbi:HD domain-containing protein [Candidatus Woesearchaeota archaeon]|nr:HD domain-containing protein [Candidatus Woesearchaeota archaeon]
MEKRRAIRLTEEFVKKRLSGDSSGHDWWHIQRVRKLSLFIAKREKADLFIVELAALLHDIGDWKFHGDEKGSQIAKAWLERLKADEKVIGQVYEIIDNVSFKGAGVASNIQSLEGRIVQDADRLDAIGAIGIGRTFAYGGYSGRAMHNPSVKPRLHKSFEEYRKSKNPTINHFYEKLLLLKGRMNTKTARKIAERRHKFMEFYLKEFFREWYGKDYRKQKA